MPALIDLTKSDAIPKFERGDAGIILKADGSFQIWNTIEDPTNLTEYQMEQGRVLLAFAAALKLPQIMHVLFAVANDPAIFDKTVETGTEH